MLLCLPEDHLIVNLDSIRFVYQESGKLFIKSSDPSVGVVDLRLADPESAKRRIEEFCMHQIRDEEK